MKTDPLSRNLSEARYRVTREIRDNPLLCVGLALGVGAVIGALGSRAAVSRPDRTRWLTDLASDWSDEARKAGSRAGAVGHRANKELHAALHQAADAVPEVDLDRLVRRGRRWLHSVLA